HDGLAFKAYGPRGHLKADFSDLDRTDVVQQLAATCIRTVSTNSARDDVLTWAYSSTYMAYRSAPSSAGTTTATPIGPASSLSTSTPGLVSGAVNWTSSIAIPTSCHLVERMGKALFTHLSTQQRCSRGAIVWW